MMILDNKQNRESDVLRLLAAERKAQGRTDLAHASRAELCHSLSKPLLRYGNCVMQIDCAPALHPVLLVEQDLGWHSANGGRYWSYSDGR
jgi:hypothetical protein